MKTITLNQENFREEIARGDEPLLVDFWAEWCGPCKMMEPLLDELAEETAGRARVAKINVEEAPEIAAEFGVQAIPSLFVFRDGQIQHRFRGVQSKAVLAAALA
jgi:thioredoxin 1